jgi:hypothetical protein
MTPTCSKAGRRVALPDAQLVITAVVLEGRIKNEVARDYDVSRYWVPLPEAAFEIHSLSKRLPHV